MNNLLQNKQIALLSFVALLVIALFILIQDWRIVLAVLLIAFSGIYFLRQSKQKNNEFLTKLAQKAGEVAAPTPSFTPTTSNIRLKDVAGLKEAKEELFEIKDFFLTPAKYRNFGARVPKGVLLVGPPGVGKTLIAKALAGEAGVPFYYQSGSSFVEIYVGMGAKKVHELFATAKKNAPALIFIDEIDSVGKKRGGNRNDEREATLNQLLTEMDGFDSDSGVIVIAATNRVEMLDDALLRAGRFDRHVHLTLPSISDRRSILNVYLSKRPHDVDVEKIASITPGFSGAALENLVNEASLHAIKHQKRSIETDDFLAVKDKVQFGKKQQVLLSPEEKEILAFYQSAKALAAKSLDVHFEKITLFEHIFLPEHPSKRSETYSKNRITAQLAGIVAYDLFYKERYDNIAQETAILEGMVAEHGRRFRLHYEAQDTTLLQHLRTEAENLLKDRETSIRALAERLVSDEVIFFDAV